MVHAGVYSAVLHYLKAVEALKSDDGTKVIAKMKEMPTDDPLFGKGTIRADGRKIHPAYLFEVKKPAESKGPWDYYKVRATIPADQAFRPLKDGDCPLVKRYRTRCASHAGWRRDGRARSASPRRSTRHRATDRQRTMTELFGVPTQALFGQLLIGLINGAFYAMLSLGLAVIFGLLNIINFTHGAQYMMGAFCAYFLLQYAGVGYWWSLLLAPIVVGATGVVIERTMLARLYQLDHLYGLLLTFGLALIIQGLFTQLLRLVRPAVPDPGRAHRRHQPRLHVPAEVPGVGDRRLARRLRRDLVRDRAHEARLVPARGDREPGAGAGVRHQRAADDHADLRLRRRPGRASPA